MNVTNLSVFLPDAFAFEVVDAAVHNDRIARIGDGVFRLHFEFLDS